MKDLKDKVAIVTGGSKGIGKCIAKGLLEEGAKVAIVASNSTTLLEATQELQQFGDVVLPFTCDLRCSINWQETYQRIVDTLGPVDILINNAGAGTFKPMDLQTHDEAMLPVQLPFGAAVAASHSVIPDMLTRKSGHIVNMISPAGILPIPNMMPYTASRYAMVGLSQSLYEELHHQGIGVTMVCPGEVNTGYFEQNDADMDWYPKISKVFPVLEPEEVARQVIRAIKKDKREVIFPASLKATLKIYGVAPRFWIKAFDTLGLWKPSIKQADSSTAASS
ncbi:MAG: SDR family NAD(P)-dependent oxidoreductase [Pseudomonadales bacterium]|nr:SDR family NAD(P)-dependent oxidoreductase [Pseudomonadales bacterium]